MTETRWQRLNELFASAVELETAAQSEFVVKSCGDDVELRREVEAMLAATRQANLKGFLKKDVFADGAKVLSDGFTETIPIKQIGNYRVVREIGRGGMGTVFLAERKGFRHQVAIKVIKRGMDTDEIIKRFRRERQVLANLNHPNIARLLDGGTTKDGLPYFVMEYVEGLSVTEFCDKEKLGITERLALFQKICSAVSYIHRNLIVHRDIKPSNILVAENGEPKLLDFGIAKLLASDDFGTTIEQTAMGSRLFTPEYASPEQINGVQITTSSDIYSLGVLLYELLCGHRPFRLRNLSAKEVLDVISREEPSAPSTAVLTTEEIGEDTGKVLSPETVASSRSERPQALRRKLSGDLDNITLKALKKEPERRYQTVEQFSEDIRKHLAGLPVTARPDTFTYRAAKFIKRNRIAVSLTALLSFAVIVGIAATIWQSVRAERQRALAEQRAAETRRLANSLVAEFDEELLNLPGSYPVRIKLAKASSDYLNRLAQDTDDPELMKELAESHYHLADAFNGNLDDPDKAKKHYQQALEISRRLVTALPDDLQAKELLAKSLVTFGRDRSEFEPIIREAMRLREEIVAANPDNAQALENLSDSYLSVGDILKVFERREEALAYYRSSIETRRRIIALLDKPEITPDEYSMVFWSYAWIGIVLDSNLNERQPAIENFQKAIEVAETAAAKFPEHRRNQANVHSAHHYLARVLVKIGDYRGALEQYQLALTSHKNSAIRFNAFWYAGEVKYLLRIVEVLQKLGRTEEALVKLREALALRREITAINHADPRNNHSHAEVFHNAGKIFAAVGKFDEAIAAYREAEQSNRKILENNPQHIFIHFRIARVYTNIGDLYAACPVDGVKIKQTNRTRLQEAYNWYKRANDLYTEHQANLNWVGDKEDSNLAKEKLAACEAKLKGN